MFGCALGIHLADEVLHAVRVRRSSHKLLWYRKIPLPGFSVADLNLDEHCRRLQVGLEELRRSEHIGRLDHIRLTVPDPLVQTRVFQLNGLPAGKAERNDVARMNFSRELHRDIDGIGCTTQYLGEEDGKKLLFSQAIDTSWRAALEQVFLAGRLPLMYVNSASLVFFNHYHDLFQGHNAAGAMVHLGERYWGLIGWNGSAVVRFAHGKRWGEGNTPLRFDDLLTEILRTLRSYMRSCGIHLDAVYLLNDGRTTPELLGRLSSHIDASRLKPLEMPLLQGGGRGAGLAAAYVAALE